MNVRNGTVVETTKGAKLQSHCHIIVLGYETNFIIKIKERCNCFTITIAKLTGLWVEIHDFQQ